jgi:hypothetical protein
MSAKNPHRFRVSLHRKGTSSTVWETPEHTHYASFANAMKRAESSAGIDCWDEIKVLMRIKGIDHTVHTIHELEIKRRCKEWNEEMERYIEENRRYI